ncbi:MAG: hypothetical protein KF716_15050 [Anaerolineae bacterium]|nr:hypothetical protein [Anaerolineae bacterium]
MSNNTYKGMRTFRKAIIGPEIYEVEHFVVVNDDARLMPSAAARRRYKAHKPTDLDWGFIGPYSLALAHSILAHDLRDEPDGLSIAAERYIAFATVFIYTLPARGSARAGTNREWVLTSAEIRQWLDQQPIILSQNKLAGF